MQSRKVGPIAVYGEPRSGSVLFLHGAYRHSPNLFHMARLVPDAVFVDLPGHGQSDLFAKPTVERLADAVSRAVDAFLPDGPGLVVGESVGAIVALQINRWPVLAIDPPTDTLRHRGVQASLRNLVRVHPPDGFLAQFSEHAFGVSRAHIERRQFFHLFERAERPVAVVTGDSKAGAFPLVDEEAKARLLHLAPIYVVPGAGHLVLDDAPTACAEIIAAFRSQIPPPKPPQTRSFQTPG